MQIITDSLLLIHILAGGLALISGLVSMITEKGKPKHLKAGFTFFVSMIVVSLSALIVSIIKDNDFLLYLGIFSFYMNYTGFRSIKNKRLLLSKLDWIITIIVLINTFFMLYQMHLILMVFGVISLALIVGQVNTYYRLKTNKQVPKLAWLAQHIGMMVGTYISTLTAFLVVNINFVRPAWIVWMIPSAVLAPMIVYWTRKYTTPKKKSS